MPPEEIVPLAAVISCPECAEEAEGVWRAPDERGDLPEDSTQLCPHCGHVWDAPWPGFSFTAEA